MWMRDQQSQECGRQIAERHPVDAAVTKFRFDPRAFAEIRLQAEIPICHFRGQLEKRDSKTDVARGACGVKRILYLLRSLSVHTVTIVNDRSR